MQTAILAVLFLAIFALVEFAFSRRSTRGRLRRRSAGSARE